MAVAKELTGEIFGRLKVISFTQSKKGDTERSKAKRFWLCLCECGKYKEVAGTSLQQGNTRSCGCLSVEVKQVVNLIHGNSRVGKMTAEYRAWLKMISRCYNKNHNSYENYGGRGIKVCDRWLNSFANFLLDMGQKPSASHSLDRFPNNDGDYEPGNCRWATKKEQENNKRRTIILKYKGVEKSISYWCDELGLRYGLVQNRLQMGYSVEDALEKPILKKGYSRSKLFSEELLRYAPSNSN